MKLEDIKVSYTRISLSASEFNDSWKAKKYICTVSYNNKELSLNFYMGRACSAPTKTDVLNCLITDDVSNMSFKDFCLTFGYAMNKKSKVIYDACDRQTKKLYRVFGDEVETLRELLQN